MEPGKEILKIDTKTTAEKCFVTIADNGAGMNEIALINCLNYFTNKPNDNGLGLANTQNIILTIKSQKVSSILQQGTKIQH